MAWLESTEGLFEQLRGSDYYARLLVALATALGLFLILIWCLKFICALIKDFQLYLVDQTCYSVDFRQRYGQWAVISGSTEGIGFALAKQFAKRGMSIVVICYDANKLKRAREALEREPNVGEILTIQCDLADSSLENYEKLRQQIDPDNRDIGILVNNVGTGQSFMGVFQEQDMEHLRQIVNLNVLAGVYLARLILPGMVERRRGLVVGLSSLLAGRANRLNGLYPCTKNFVDLFCELVRRDCGASNIKVVALKPSAVHTNLLLPLMKYKFMERFATKPDDFARSAVNALATPYKFMGGHFAHEQHRRVIDFVDFLGIGPVASNICIRIFGNVQRK